MRMKRTILRAVETFELFGSIVRVDETLNAQSLGQNKWKEKCKKYIFPADHFKDGCALFFIHTRIFHHRFRIYLSYYYLIRLCSFPCVCLHQLYNYLGQFVF